MMPCIPTNTNLQYSMMPSSKIIDAKQRKKERVCFSFKDDVFIIERYDNMISQDEKATLWYTDQDHMRIQHSIRKTLRTIRNNMNINHRCIRGLEHMISPEHFEQIKVNADCVYFGVLREQQRQQRLGVYDPEEIRKVSVAASLWARNVALEKGVIYSLAVITAH
mmetsp:Transcript_45298/g.68313  ORF Transcript_45298/g.68313 Transcript_45298/m.68313 type:complete len:165 (-) Transcript_45298:313-807(-)